MIKKFALIIGTTVLAMTATIAQAKLSVVTQSVAHYTCDNNTKIAVTYAGLSNKSLNFVTFTVGKEQITLPQVVSGSGIRYTDLAKYELFSKGDVMMLDADVNDDKSTVINCTVAKTAKKK